MKRTYVNRLPKNEEVKNTNVRIENGELIVEVDFKEKFEPKDGDFLISKYGNIFIYSDKQSRSNIAYSSYCGVRRITQDVYLEFSDDWTIKEGCRFATPEEKYAFLERLEKECGKKWNEETKQLEDIRWKPKEGDYYFFVDSDLKIRRTRNVTHWDFIRVNINNCFPTEESAQPYADQMKSIFKNSKAE